MQALEIISRKRDGGEHTPDEIDFLLSGYLKGDIPDYQMAAWLMAVCIRGMTRAETLALTQAMVQSGEVLDLSGIPGTKVDKHSTGGVGDKVTLIGPPLAAACGVKVPKLSGRALAHTGGTLDKLESVPGRTVALVTAMDNPLGRSVGNALEVQEALDALAGKGDEELVQVSLVVAREMCWLAEVDTDPGDALRSGAGRAKFLQMLAAQGGQIEKGLPVAPFQLPVPALGDGYVESIDALEVGLAGLELGVGRKKKEDLVDPGAGIVIQAPVGARVRAGEPLAIVHARSEELARSVMPRLQKAWRLSAHEVARPPHVLARVDKDGVTRAG